VSLEPSSPVAVNVRFWGNSGHGARNGFYEYAASQYLGIFHKISSAQFRLSRHEEQRAILLTLEIDLRGDSAPIERSQFWLRVG